MHSLPAPFASRRRTLLLGLGALLLTGAAPASPEDKEPSCDGPPMPEGGGDRQGKFDAQGKPLLWPGNTTICPFAETHPLSVAMLEMNALIRRDWSDHIVPTPPSSYHMTILGGVDPEQKAKNNWPSGISPSVTLAQTTPILRERIAATTFDFPEKIEMEIDADRFHAPLVGVPLRPANAAMATALYDLRRQLAEAIGFHPDNLMSFMFHATYGYKYRHIPHTQKAPLRRAVHEWRRVTSEKLGIIEIPAPVFCSFETMFAFTPLLPLLHKG
ncbi:DUF1868 domain-containing protein [Asaia krungthepensis]|nr:DUF1868 domain-containing protein [Asaia krungthepensis]